MEKSRMDIAVELSMYPLQTDRIPVIKAFIERLQAADGIRVIPNSLSTQVVGSHERVFEVLTREMREAFGAVERAVFVMKVVGPLADPGAIK